MISRSKTLFLYGALVIISWLFFFQLLMVDTNGFDKSKLSWHLFYQNTALCFIFISILLYQKLKMGISLKNSSFTEIQWKNSISNIAYSVILFILHKIFFIFFEYNSVAYSLFHSFFIVIVTVASTQTFFVFKKMVLYYKNKIIINFWEIYEYLIVVTILCNFLDTTAEEDLSFYLAMVPMVGFGLVMSFQIKWVPYLSFKLKLRSILYMMITFLSFLLILYIGFFYSKSHFCQEIDVLFNVFLMSLVVFCISYSLFSSLVLVFNLPTSSVFEQKFGEVMNLRKLSEIIKEGSTEEDVCNILLESSITTSFADSAVVEMTNSIKDKTLKHYFRSISKDSFYKIKILLRKNKQLNYNQLIHIKDFTNLKYITSQFKLTKNSMLAVPIMNYNEILGVIYLFSNSKNNFEKEVIDIIQSYANQAGTSIRNFRLVNDAVINARYKEELVIAKKVQESLLPNNIFEGNGFKMAAFSKSADEVGGDYFDYFKINDQKFAFIIGDVSGKGTSAAFQMAQMKGVFHSLMQLDITPKQFVEYANLSLAQCLEKGSFITVTLLIIDTAQKTYSTARAGHCRTLLFEYNTKKAIFLKDEGLGLGILRNNKFDQFLKVESGSYQTGDTFLLYTDGITEANNPQGEEYGEERIKLFLEQNYHEGNQLFIKKLIEDLYLFEGSNKILDDFTALVLKLD